MGKILQARAFWFAAVLALSGAMLFAACETDSPPSPGPTGCAPLGSPCGTKTTCCSPTSCINNICDARVPCVRPGGRCNSSSDCCGTATCRSSPQGNWCDDGSCQGRGGACNSSSDCCGTLVCRSGACLD